MASSASDVKSIYVTLVSTASTDLYPNNSAANFTNLLKNPIVLSSNNWEVALMDIQLPAILADAPLDLVKSHFGDGGYVRHLQPLMDIKTPYHLSTTNFTNEATLPESLPTSLILTNRDLNEAPSLINTVTIDELRHVRHIWEQIDKEETDEEERNETVQRCCDAGTPASDSSSSSEHTWRLWYLPGAYNTLQDLIDYYDRSVRALFLLPYWKFMEYDRFNGRVCYYHNNLMGFIRFHNCEVNRMLGLSTPYNSRDTTISDYRHGVPITRTGDSKYVVQTDKRYARWFPDMTSRHKLFVNTDCIAVSNVGDSTGQLLRQINTYSKFNLEFAVPQYRPVLRDKLDTIEIDIRNLRGIHPAFQRSSTTCTLHFRECV